MSERKRSIINVRGGAGMDDKLTPKIIRPFEDSIFQDLQNHVKEVRRIFDWRGNAYHDANEPDDKRMNRYFWHNLPLLQELHNSRAMINLASDVFGQDVKPSYVFLSMYGPQGVVPLHSDRPQCVFTIDLLIHSNHKDRAWPIYVENQPYQLEKPGDALCYSGTGQPHFRKPMSEDSDATKVDLAFFHFVPVSFHGKLD